MIHIDAIEGHARSSRHRLAMVDLGSDRQWSYGDLDAAVNRLGAWLVGQFGGASAARVAAIGKNRAELVVLQLACVRAGCIFVPLNWRLAPSELEALMADATPALVFYDDAVDPPPGGRWLPLARALQLGGSGDKPPPDSRRPFDEVSTLLYTSGTSGRPKGVMVSEENVYWSCTNFNLGSGVTMHSVFLCDMPLFHTAGLLATARSPLLAGGRVLLSQGFHSTQTLERLSDPALRVSHYFSVPQMAARVLSEPGFRAERLRHLTCWAIGGAPHPRTDAERLAAAGIRFSDGFGMSELGSAMGMPAHDPETTSSKLGSCGVPFLAIEAKIVDEEGREKPAGAVGELWVRGPSVTRGYWNQEGTTKEAFAGGWFRTGDAAKVDPDGFFYIVDRKKDMFISGGENVYPAQVESTIAEIPGVAESAVVGVPDARWGEVGRAYVVAVPGKPLTPADIIEHCQRRLAKYKAPQSAVITESLPRTASGKLKKHVLRARAKQEASVS